MSGRHDLAALKMAGLRLGSSSCDLKASLEELMSSIAASDLDPEFKQAMIEGLEKWTSQLDRLIPVFNAMDENNNRET